MRKQDINPNGGRYRARIGKFITTVRLTGESSYGGYNAINEMTGRQVRIKTAAKLRRPAARSE